MKSRPSKLAPAAQDDDQEELEEEARPRRKPKRKRTERSRHLGNQSLPGRPLSKGSLTLRAGRHNHQCTCLRVAACFARPACLVCDSRIDPFIGVCLPSDHRAIWHLGRSGPGRSWSRPSGGANSSHRPIGIGGPARRQRRGHPGAQAKWTFRGPAGSKVSEARRASGSEGLGLSTATMVGIAALVRGRRCGPVGFRFPEVSAMDSDWHPFQK